MTASTPRSSRTSARTRGCCSSATLGEKDAPVARPPQSRRAGPTRRSPFCVRRESPAQAPRGAYPTFFSALPSQIPRAPAVRGRCDTSRAPTFARPPHTGCAGAWRRPPLCVRHESPAQALCGAVATFCSANLSRDPRTSAARGVSDVLLVTSVANPPHTSCAGPLRHFSRPDCRESPAQAPRGAYPTFFSALPSRGPRISVVRGRRDTPPAPHAAPVLCQFVRICLNSLKSSTLLAGSPMQATLGKGQL